MGEFKVIDANDVPLRTRYDKEIQAALELAEGKAVQIEFSGEQETMAAYNTIYRKLQRRKLQGKIRIMKRGNSIYLLKK